jgi:enoyl-CoA hydratase/carnithine racemase
MRSLTRSFHIGGIAMQRHDGERAVEEQQYLARELAVRIVRHSPLAVGGIITAVSRGLNMGIAEGLQVESEQFAALVATRDLGEGINAWIERRPPRYTGC